MKLKYCLLCILLSVLQVKAQQQSTGKIITGKVVTTNSLLPVAGATISLLHNKNSVFSNADGTFSIQLNTPADTLNISHVSYKNQRIKIDLNTTTLLITLNELLTQMNDVVVSTGYENIPKERATGSFDFVDNKLFNRSISTGVLNHIENVVPGVLFDRNTNAPDALLIRGRSTIYANAAPLIILDNFPYDGSINSINPNDIESVTILKDAAAASIWGARAGNGVIVITTKKGRTQKPLVQLNTSITFTQKPNIYNVSQINSSDYIEREQYLYAQGFYDNAINSFYHAPLTPVIEVLLAKTNGTLSQAAANAQIESLKQYDVRDDMSRYFYQGGVNQQHQLNISGAVPAVNYYFSAGWDKNLLTLVGSEFNRITLRTQNTFNITDKLHITAAINYVQSTEESGANPGYNYLSYSGKRFYPYAQLADESGNPIAINLNYNSAFTSNAQQQGLLNWQYKPLADIREEDNKNRINDYTINAGATYNILNGLSAAINYQYEASLSDLKDLHRDSSWFARDMINQFTQVDADGVLTYPVPVGGILDAGNATLQSHQGRAQVSYNQLWGTKHRLTAIAGWEIKQVKTISFKDRYYGYNENHSTVSSQVDYANYYTLYNNPYFTTTITNPQDISNTTDRFISCYANAAYTYDERYTLSASAREDKANLFGVKTNQQGTPLWSAGGAWHLNHEKFYKINWLPLLSLRLTYGANGNISRLASAYTVVNFSGSPVTPAEQAEIISPANKQLRWEKIRIFNAGIDFETKNHRIYGSIEYYRKQSKDLIGQAPLDPTLGLSNTEGQSFYYGNVAEMKGRGVDATINSTNLNRAIKWYTTFLFSYAYSEITKYLLPESKQGSTYFTPVGLYYINPVEGKPVFSLYSYRWGGLDPQTGNPLGMLNGKASSDYVAMQNLPLDSLVYSGPVQPVYFGAMRNTFTWKQLSLSFNISYKLGYNFRKPSIDYSSLVNTWNGSGDYGKRWQQPGDELTTNVPSFVYPVDSDRDNFYRYSDVLVYKGDNIRFEDISISYDITKQQWHNMPFSSLRVNVYAYNLGLLWTANKEHIDPYYINIPKAGKSVAIGLNINF